ncbi:MAG: dTMP kinase [Rikenellaceae bacterium]|nr:dTMP kinase [Rikenellaceae bacterium]
MFIVLEGVDGAGKSTQIALLEEYFKRQGKECVRLHFPRFEAPIYGDMIARFLRGEFGSVEQVNPYLVALLYAGDRADAAAMIRGWLTEGKVVIVDRYVYSNIGYQCAKVADPEARKALKEWILTTEYEQFAIPQPDLSLFLDVPFKFTERSLTSAREGDDRDYLNGAEDIHESSLDLQRAVRQTYLDAATTDTALRVVDCSNGAGEMDSPEAIHLRILQHLNR